MTKELLKKEISTILLLALVYENSICRSEKIEAINNLVGNLKDFAVAKLTLEKLSKNAWNKGELEFKKAQDANIKTISILDLNYPIPLRHIPDPPPVLFVKTGVNNPRNETGVADEYFAKHIAIVGMRNASYEGKIFTRELAKELTRHGATIVSGLAMGIDSAAHQGALMGCAEFGNSINQLNGGVAVLGSGVNAIFPENNTELADRILEAGGSIISEFGVDTKPRSYFFPARNRIVSGISKATIVVEARLRSGSLITARLALEQGREVFAVPGSVYSEHSAGTNALIKDGAHVLTNFRDVFDVLRSANWTDLSKSDTNLLGAADDCSEGVEPKEEKLIVSSLKGRQAASFDELVELTGISPQKLTSYLLSMEIQGQIFKFPGNLFSSRRFIDN